jgi:hypothetical protein
MLVSLRAYGNDRPLGARRPFRIERGGEGEQGEEEHLEMRHTSQSMINLVT